jgi:hypothetical protein
MASSSERISRKSRLLEYAMTPFGQSLYECPPAASNNGAGQTRSADDEIVG